MPILGGCATAQYVGNIAHSGPHGKVDSSLERSTCDRGHAGIRAEDSHRTRESRDQRGRPGSGPVSIHRSRILDGDLHSSVWDCLRIADRIVDPRAGRVADALEGSVASRAVGSADGGGDAADDGVLEKCPQNASGQAQPSDFIGDPHAEGPSAAATPMAVAAARVWLIPEPTAVSSRRSRTSPTWG